MHVVIAAIYGFTVWLSALAFAIVVRADWVLVLWLGPVVVSGSMVFLWCADWLIWRTWNSFMRAVRGFRAQS